MEYVPEVPEDQGDEYPEDVSREEGDDQGEEKGVGEEFREGEFPIMGFDLN